MRIVQINVSTAPTTTSALSSIRVAPVRSCCHVARTVTIAKPDAMSRKVSAYPSCFSIFSRASPRKLSKRLLSKKFSPLR